jgi:beta-lactamase regulating signal transducer with metallopeptidase domain
MSEITAILQHPHVEHLALTLIHFVWQGLVVAGLVYVGLKVLSNHAPKVRYQLALVGLLILVASPIATFCLLATTPPLPATLAFHTEVDPASLSLATTVVDQGHQSNPPATWQAVSLNTGSAAWAYGTIVVIWLGGVLFFSLRLALGLRQVRRLVSEGTTVLAEPLQRVLNKVLTKAEMHRPVIALQSLLVEVPSVVGWLKPCILLPASILVGLPVQHLEALLAHEVVHIKRRDYLVNLAQHIIEALLFYHPATWWISNQIRIEREQCCDDAAVDLLGHRSLYIEALARLEFIRGEISEPALAATGGSLLSRLRRLTTPQRSVNHSVAWLAGIASLSILSVVTIAMVHLLPHSVAFATERCPCFNQLMIIGSCQGPVALDEGSLDTLGGGIFTSQKLTCKVETDLGWNDLVTRGWAFTNVKTGELPGRCSLSVLIPTEPTAVLAKHNDTLTAAQSDVCLMHLCVAAWALGLSDDDNLCNNS